MALDFIFFTILKHSASHPQHTFRILYVVFKVITNHELTNVSLKNFTLNL